MTIQENAVLPAAYAENLAHPAPAHTGLRNTLRRWTGFDLTPSEEVVRQYGAGLWITDPVAESFVEEVYYGQIGPEHGRALLERALSEGIDAVEEAPESMRALFAEFDTLPPWADPQLIEAGAAVWRRWGYDMGSIANAGTMDTYTEGWLATPCRWPVVMRARARCTGISRPAGGGWNAHDPAPPWTDTQLPGRSR